MSAKVKIQLNEPAVRGLVRQGGFPLITRFADDYAVALKRNVGVDWNGVPSRPGRFPRKRTGALQRSSVRLDFPDRFAVQVVEDIPYGMYLEKGTPKMAPRPHMSPTWAAAVRRGIR